MKQVLCFICLLLSSTACYALEYIMIVDAGSSGSRLYIYSYEPHQALGSLRINTVASLKVEPGLSVFARDRSVKPTEQYLQPLLNLARKKIPPQQQAKTPLYWYSTAGMRFTSPSLQEITYQRVVDVIQAQSPFKVKEIGTITGTVEGLYMWLAANYKLNTLVNNKPLGILDMGGGSTQIVFPLRPKKKRQTIKRIIFPQHTFTLYSHSFLGLGRNAARYQFSNETHCFSKGYTLPNGRYAQGNYKQCQQHVSDFIHARHKVSKQLKSLPKIKFVSFDGFYKTAKRLNLDHISIDTLSQAGQRVCQSPWQQVNAKPHKDNFKNCFNSAYFSELLRHYGFKPTTQLDINDASWTLGKAVLLAADGKLD